MHNLNPSRWFSTVVLVIGVITAIPAWAQYDDIIGFHVLSESDNELMLEIQSYYTGSRGATAYLSVLPTVSGSVTSRIGYSAGRCPNSNNIAIGSNSTCIMLSSVGGGNPFSTDGLQICMFGGPDRASFHCENFGHMKQWGAYPGYAPPPGQPPAQAPHPDLMISAIEVFPAQPQAGQYFAVNVYVRNAGQAPSGEYDLAIFIRDVSRGYTYPVGTFRKGGLQPGDNVVAYSSTDRLVNEPGAYQVHVEIRPFLFEDGNGQNNSAIWAFGAR